MQTIVRTVSAASLITVLLLTAALPASAVSATLKDPADASTGVVERMGANTAPSRALDGALERLAARSDLSTRYAGVTERLAARLGVGDDAVVAAAPGHCGDGKLLAE